MQIKKIELPNIKDYFIDTNGNVYYYKNHLKKFSEHIVHGYSYVTLQFKDGTNKHMRVHRLMGLMFLPVPEKYKDIQIDKLQINHKDGNKLNNKLSNLEWCTQSENIIHAYNKKLWTPLKIQKHSILVNVYDINGNIMYENITISETSRRLGCSKSSVSRAYKIYNGLLESKNVIIKCNDYPLANHIK